MNTLAVSILAAYSPPRERIYRALLAQPHQDWRVGQLAEQVPDVSVAAIRTAFYLLLGDRLVDLVPHRRSLTLRLNGSGLAMLRQITTDWQRSHQTNGSAS